MTVDALPLNGDRAHIEMPTSGEPARMTAIRGSAAALVRHMENSLTVPTATTIRTIAVGALDRARAVLADRGRSISASRLIAYAVVRAAVAVPGITHRFVTTAEGAHRAIDGAVHLGIAVDVPRRDGSRQVLVPVLHDAGSLDLDGFILAYNELIAAARAGTLTPKHFLGANLILTNTGAFGSTSGVPRLPVGPAAIVAVGALGYPAGFEQIGRDLGVSRVCVVSSTYDHRVVQGADSGAFLGQLAAALVDEGSAFYMEVLGNTPGPTSPVPTQTVGTPGPAPAQAASPSVVADAVRELDALRRDGYRQARLDPLAELDAGDTATGSDAANRWPAVTTADVGLDGPVRPFAEAYGDLLDAYCGTLAIDVWHLRDARQRAWWFDRLERADRPMGPAERAEALGRLVAIETLERFLQRAYPGHKSLSVQGLDSTVLMTQTLVDLAASRGASRVYVGMAHRGRLNVLAHVTGMPYARLLAEFEATTRDDAVTPAGSNADVKQHLGWETEREVAPGRTVRVALLPNPSHLEFVSPVALGATRAHHDRTATADGLDAGSALAILMHGDAAFTGQGVVAETLNLHALRGYTVGGAVHIVQDNQLGFTTEREQLRSTQWPSDIARGYDVPIVHVNADDPEACIRAVRLALDFRDEFERDVVLHVLGYRRLGHTEADEPTFTQPQLYRRIARHPSVVEIYAASLIERGELAAGRVDELRKELQQTLRAAHEQAATASCPPVATAAAGENHKNPPGTTSVAQLTALAQELLYVPETVTPHPKVVRMLNRRRELLQEERLVDWPHAEVLALATAAAAGVPVRLSGQDVVRGTFTQRHLSLQDVTGGPAWTPLLAATTAQVWNSPLSETAVLGFEYGYSLGRPDALALWEAQFGDFANGGQVIVDQFISSGYAKWGARSRLVMLLPHGYEGSGPEHSSARLERYLQLSAESNWTVAVPTTPGQYYSLLVGQAFATAPSPLVIFTPKSLLRHKAVVSSIDDLARGEFASVLPWVAAGRDEDVRRVLVCTGKVFYDLAEQAEAGGHTDLAVLRIEQLYPFPADAVRDALARYPGLAELSWVQEEPLNMGAAQHVMPLLEAASPLGKPVRYVGRDVRAATAEGYGSTHRRVQAALVKAAVDGE